MIAGLWNPQYAPTTTRAPRAWKVNLGWNSEPVFLSSAHGQQHHSREGEDGGKAERERQAEEGRDGRGEHGREVGMVMNQPATLNEIARIGGDLIARIEVLKGSGSGSGSSQASF